MAVNLLLANAEGGSPVPMLIETFIMCSSAALSVAALAMVVAMGRVAKGMTDLTST
jgi:hypothetical protein